MLSPLISHSGCGQQAAHPGPSDLLYLSRERTTISDELREFVADDNQVSTYCALRGTETAEDLRVSAGAWPNLGHGQELS